VSFLPDARVVEVGLGDIGGAAQPGAGEAGADHGSSTSVVTGPVAGDWEASQRIAQREADLAFVLGELELLGVLRRQHQRHHGDFGGARVDRLPGR